MSNLSEINFDYAYRLWFWKAKLIFAGCSVLTQQEELFGKKFFRPKGLFAGFRCRFRCKKKRYTVTHLAFAGDFFGFGWGPLTFLFVVISTKNISNTKRNLRKTQEKKSNSTRQNYVCFSGLSDIFIQTTPYLWGFSVTFFVKSELTHFPPLNFFRSNGISCNGISCKGISCKKNV